MLPCCPTCAHAKGDYDERLTQAHKPEAIFKQNKTWVGGSTILGRASVMKNMVKQYITYTMDYINDTLINSDSQVVYAMHQNSKKLSVTAQAFPVDDRYKLGDQLAFLMKEAGQF